MQTATDSRMALIERGPSSRQPTRKLMNEISIHVCNLCGQHEPAPAPCVRQASNAYHLLDQSERPRPNKNDASHGAQDDPYDQGMSAHATVDRAFMRGQAGGTFEWIGLIHHQACGAGWTTGSDGSGGSCSQGVRQAGGDESASVMECVGQWLAVLMSD